MLGGTGGCRRLRPTVRRGNGKVLVNLEDFKSFRRVLKPPEVGSIPTHSRHLLTACAVWLAVSLAAPARAQDENPIPGPGALNRAMRSVVLPAWGQVTNGREVKAAVLFSVETYIWTRAIMESRKGTESRRHLHRSGHSAHQHQATTVLLLVDKNALEIVFDGSAGHQLASALTC